MTIGFIGLGRMGYNMVRRLCVQGVDVVAYNRSFEKTRSVARYGADPAKTVKELVDKLPKRKIIWLMLPAGAATEEYLKELLPMLSRDDIVIDGANDFFGNAVRHSAWFAKRGIHFFDCGVSGGIWGRVNGFTLMIGGPQSQFKMIEPICKALAPKTGYGYFGPAGCGHFVKSVHNMVEYIYLQGIAEGVELLNSFPRKIDIKKAISVWRPASVVRSWLVDLTDLAINRPDFRSISPKIDSVTINELLSTKRAVKGFSPAFDVAVRIRRDKSKKFILGKRTIAAVRREFGGHSVNKAK